MIVMYYNSSNGSIYYECHGTEGAPAIVFCHGVGMDHRTFDDQVKALKSHYRVIVWDMPFHGKSCLIDKRLNFSAIAADMLMELLDNLNIHGAILAGLSLGSYVVQKAALKYPDRVLAATHISGGSLYPKYPSYLKAFNPLISFIIAIYPNLYQSFAKHKSITPDTQAYLAETAEKTGKKAIAHLTKAMLDDMVSDFPEQPKHPVLIMYGDHDLGFIKKMAQQWHASLSDSQIAMVVEAHHIANQDNPEAFNKILLSFLNGLSY